MHELGHNFHLDHGGVVAGVPDGHNCKPHYVSIMNYQNQFGIIQAIPVAQFSDTDRDGALDPFVTDYFPPRHQGGRSNFFPGGITITETALSEAVVFDATDPNSMFVFGARPLVPPPPPMPAGGVLTQFPVQGRDLNGDGINEIDWNGNGLLDPGTVAVDVDSAVIADCASQTMISPTPLVAEDDWENIQLAFGAYPDAADGAHNPSQESGATTQELLEARRVSFRTDLSMTLQPPVAAPAIGTSFNLDVVIHNHGPSRSVGLTAHIDLPEGTTFVSSSANCQEYFTATLDCTLVDIYPGEVLEFPVTLRLTPMSADVPLLFAGQVSQPVADDSNPSNNNPETHINRPPVCNAGGPYTLECGGATTQLTLDGSGSSDPDGDSLTFSWSGAYTPANASGVAPTVTVSGLGNKAISLSVSDGSAGVSCNSSATVEDTLPPTVVASPVTVTRCLPTTEDVTVTAIATDSCSDAPTLTGELVFVAGKMLATPIPLASNPASIALPPGEARVEWRAVDASGNVETVTQVVTVNVQETAAVCCATGQTQVQGTAGVDILLRPFSTPYCAFGLGANDYVITGTGKDFIAGGPGDDTIDSGLSNGDTVSGGIGNDWLNVTTGTATTLYGGDGNDIIEPSSAATIFGNAGDDYIQGLLGAHVIYPGPGRDTVHAGAGDDTIVIRNVCEVANLELLDGGLGNDTLVTPVPVTELQARGVILLGINNVIIKTDEQHLSQCF